MPPVQRSILLAFSFAFGIIAVGFGLNTLVKSNQQKGYIKRNAPPGVVIYINTDDVLFSGICVAVSSVVIAILALISLIYDHIRTFRPYRAPKTYRLLSYFTFLFVAWDLASLIAYDYIARTRAAKITAFAGEEALPESAIAAQAQSLGVSAEYWSNDFVQWLAIVPWITILFGLLAGIELFRASNKAAEDAPSKTHTHFVHDAPFASKAGFSSKTDVEEEKGEVKVQDGAGQV